MSLIGSYLPGRTVLHRIPAGTKLLAMIAVSSLVVVFRSELSTTALIGFVTLLAVMGRISVRRILPTSWGLYLTFALLTAYHMLQSGPIQAYTVVGALIGLFALASVFTATTSTDDLMRVITRGAQPLRHLGVNPELVALAFSLLIRGIPTALDLLHETRQAALARGLDRNLRAHLVPVAIRTVLHARATGDALHARGIGD